MARGDWKRVSRRRPCPICERPDWCLYVGDDDAPSAVICARVESTKPVGEKGAGWLHVLRNDSPTWAPWKRTVHVAVRQMGPEASASPEAIAREAEAAAASTAPERLERFAEALGVSADSLRRLGVGYMVKRRAWGFPMRDASGEVTGARLRLATGKKLSIRGGKEGLFILSGIEPGGRLMIAEGPSDTAALLTLGFACVGRPSCTGGVKHLVALAQRLKPEEVVIVADGDEPGQRGAERLATALLAYAPAVRIITPPAKDAREWVRGGATRADVEAVISATAKKALKIRVSSNHESASLCARG